MLPICIVSEFQPHSHFRKVEAGSRFYSEKVTGAHDVTKAATPLILLATGNLYNVLIKSTKLKLVLVGFQSPWCPPNSVIVCSTNSLRLTHMFIPIYCLYDRTYLNFYATGIEGKSIEEGIHV